MFPSAVTALTGAGRSRSPERAGRERACLGERESEGARGARGEREGGGRAPGGLRWGEAAPGARGSAEGAESGRATPSPAGRTRSRGGRSGGLAEDRARRRRGKAGETQRLCGVRPETPGWQETEGGKGAHALEVAGADSGTGAELHPEACNSWRVRGGVRARLQSARSGKEPAQPRVGLRNVPGRASSSGLAGRTRCGCARGTNAASAGPRQKQSPAEPAASSVIRRLRPALLAVEPLRTRCGGVVGSAPLKARENPEVA